MSAAERWAAWVREAGAEPEIHTTDDGGTLLEVEGSGGRGVALALHPTRAHALVVREEHGEPTSTGAAWARGDVERLVAWMRGAA